MSTAQIVYGIMPHHWEVEQYFLNAGFHRVYPGIIGIVLETVHDYKVIGDSYSIYINEISKQLDFKDAIEEHEAWVKSKFDRSLDLKPKTFLIVP